MTFLSHRAVGTIYLLPATSQVMDTTANSASTVVGQAPLGGQTLFLSSYYL